MVTLLAYWMGQEAEVGITVWLRQSGMIFNSQPDKAVGWAWNR
jgi:hypothetical protein